MQGRVRGESPDVPGLPCACVWLRKGCRVQNVPLGRKNMGEMPPLGPKTIGHK